VIWLSSDDIGLFVLGAVLLLLAAIISMAINASKR